MGYPVSLRVRRRAALVHEGEVIHAAFFRMEAHEEPERMASYRSRRRHFTE